MGHSTTVSCSLSRAGAFAADTSRSSEPSRERLNNVVAKTPGAAPAPGARSRSAAAHRADTGVSGCGQSRDCLDLASDTKEPVT